MPAAAAAKRPQASVKATAQTAVHVRQRNHYEMLVMFGPPAHGKSSLADEIVRAYEKAGGKVWICDPSNAWPRHRGRFWPQTGPKAGDFLIGLDDMLWQLRNAGPGLLVLDDADRYMKHPTRAREDLIVSFRHWQKDVLIISRRPQGIPKDCIQNADALAVFATREVYARRYIGEQFGNRSISKQIPKVKFQYLYVRQDAEELQAVVLQTKPREGATRSDKAASLKR